MTMHKWVIILFTPLLVVSFIQITSLYMVDGLITVLSHQ